MITMKKFRLFIVLAVITALVFSLTACQKEEEDFSPELVTDPIVLEPEP